MARTRNGAAATARKKRSRTSSPALAELELALVQLARGGALDQVAREGRVLGVAEDDHGGDEHGRTALFDPEAGVSALVDVDKHGRMIGLLP